MLLLNIYQDIGSNYLHIFCICSSSDSLWRTIEQRYSFFFLFFSFIFRLYYITRKLMNTNILWIYFASKLDGSVSTVETLVSTAICGIIHSIFGGQPLLILGVAEPTIIMYTYMYKFAKGREDLGQTLYLAWAGWVCVWTALMLFLLAIFNACNIINRFTRIAGETFGMLISVLFIQEAIKEFLTKSASSAKHTYRMLFLCINCKFDA
ncbi:boron transporter 4-like isoform X2 [Lycium barbarum]|uniref:boron transporter 4-like isoform X2 n=1 Tax=Lycium barbarum TaxID=112863 RepID=UPI00293E41BE|nr:boron transporter 4-like isoform X2 [Lycium barbarum]